MAVEVEPVHSHIRGGAGDPDGRPPSAAGHVGHARAGVRLEAGVEIGNGGQPLLAEELEEGRPVLGRLRLADVRAECPP
jgi:hypothetical protein